MKTTVTKLRRVREAKGLSIFQLSMKTGVTGQTLRNWEAGTEPALGKLRCVAAALEVPLEDLFDQREPVAV